MVLEAGYPNTRGFRKVVKASIMIKKKPDMTDEAFIEHYNHIHAAMAAKVLLKHNVISYTLVSRFHTPVVSSFFALAYRIQGYIERLFLLALISSH